MITACVDYSGDVRCDATFTMRFQKGDTLKHKKKRDLHNSTEFWVKMRLQEIRWERSDRINMLTNPNYLHDAIGSEIKQVIRALVQKLNLQ